MKIAVVGGGIFGCTTAWFLAKNGYSVDLFEKNKDIFMSASGINQFRLHRGYHYPRSKDTILSCLYGEKRFREFYRDCVIDDPHEHYYGIAKEKTFASAEHCFKIWSECGLEFEPVEAKFINKEKFQTVVKVKEAVIDPQKFKDICLEKMKQYGVRVFLNRDVNYGDLKEYDFVIIATYASINPLLKDFPSAQIDYQFELIEKLVLKLPKKYDNISFVVGDGPFTCIDPYGRTGYTLMGNVEHAIHQRVIGKNFEIPENFRGLVDNGIIKNPPITNFGKFIDAAETFFPGIKKDAVHVGSMFTVRTVLPKREHDDARPTVVEMIDDRAIKVFSGKIPTCIDAAEEVLNILKCYSHK